MSARLMRAESNEIPSFEEMPWNELQRVQKTEIPTQNNSKA